MDTDVDTKAIESIDLFFPPNQKSRYGALSYFTKQLAKSLEKAHIKTRILTPEKSNPQEFVNKLLENRPDCTLSFNGLLPDEKGNFLSDLLKIPHVAVLVDSGSQYLALTESLYTIVTVPDKFNKDFLQGLKNARVFFLPHGADATIQLGSEADKEYDVSMLSSCIDYEKIEENWKNKYPPNIYTVLKQAVDISINSAEISPIQAFAIAVDQSKMAGEFSSYQTNFIQMIDEIEMYVDGKDRVELMKAFIDTPIHLFSYDSNLWKKYLGSAKSNIIYHDEVDFDEAIQVMQKSKVVLNSCSSLKNATHERILSAMLAGAVVITGKNVFMSENFENDKHLLMYQPGKWSEAAKLTVDLLQNENKRKLLVKNGRDLVLEKHTWDERAKLLLKELPAFLNSVGF